MKIRIKASQIVYYDQIIEIGVDDLENMDDRDIAEEFLDRYYVCNAEGMEVEEIKQLTNK